MAEACSSPPHPAASGNQPSTTRTERRLGCPASPAAGPPGLPAGLRFPLVSCTHRAGKLIFPERVRHFSIRKTLLLPPLSPATKAEYEALDYSRAQGGHELRQGGSHLLMAIHHQIFHSIAEHATTSLEILPAPPHMLTKDDAYSPRTRFSPLPC